MDWQTALTIAIGFWAVVFGAAMLLFGFAVSRGDK